MSKSDFIKMIDTLDIAKITYFILKYENYEINNKNNELSFNNEQEG